MGGQVSANVWNVPVVQLGDGDTRQSHRVLLCFALRALGFGVTPMLARVRWNKPPGHPQPLGHLVLLVTLPQWPVSAATPFSGQLSVAGTPYLADVGFAGGRR